MSKIRTCTSKDGNICFKVVIKHKKISFVQSFNFKKNKNNRIEFNTKLSINLNELPKTKDKKKPEHSSITTKCASYNNFEIKKEDLGCYSQKDVSQEIDNREIKIIEPPTEKIVKKETKVTKRPIIRRRYN